MKPTRGKTPSFHTRGIRWRYSDNTVLVIDRNGSARREEPKQFRTKKERKKARAAAKKGRKS